MLWGHCRRFACLRPISVSSGIGKADPIKHWALRRLRGSGFKPGLDFLGLGALLWGRRVERFRIAVSCYSLPASCSNSCNVKLSLKVTCIRPREGLPSGNNELNDPLCCFAAHTEKTVLSIRMRARAAHECDGRHSSNPSPASSIDARPCSSRARRSIEPSIVSASDCERTGGARHSVQVRWSRRNRSLSRA